MLNSLRNFLKNKKTYILGSLMLLMSVEKYLTGDITLSQFLTTVQGIVGFNGLGFITLRAAFAKLQNQPAIVEQAAPLNSQPPTPL